MEKAFANAYTARKDEIDKTFRTIKLVDDSQPEVESYHFVFILDESGSMKPHWKSLEDAYKKFLDSRNSDQGGTDHVTVVQFDNKARPICKYTPVRNNPMLSPLANGGTDYCVGLNEADRQIAADQSASSVLIIFMSDGGDGSGQNPLDLVHQMKQKYSKKHNFVCHTIGFGPDIKPGSTAEKLLKDMASVGGGKMYSAKDGEVLLGVFGEIAANSTTSDALVERFSEILAENISVKITLDFF